MANKLEYERSIQLVESAMRRTTSTTFSHRTVLHELLPNLELREMFRIELRNNVRAHGFGIKSRRIPLDPHVTIHDVALAVTSLAGDPTVDDD
jgi:hypothetical protein